MFTVVFMNWLIKENIPLGPAKLEYHATSACSQLCWTQTRRFLSILTVGRPDCLTARLERKVRLKSLV